MTASEARGAYMGRRFISVPCLPVWQGWFRAMRRYPHASIGPAPPGSAIPHQPALTYVIPGPMTRPAALPDDMAGLRAANSLLRGRLAERDAEVAALRAGLDTARELRRRLELRLARLERRLGMDSTDSGTPSSKERSG